MSRSQAKSNTNRFPLAQSTQTHADQNKSGTNGFSIAIACRFLPLARVHLVCSAFLN